MVVGKIDLRKTWILSGTVSVLQRLPLAVSQVGCLVFPDGCLAKCWLSGSGGARLSGSQSSQTAGLLSCWACCLARSLAACLPSGVAAQPPSTMSSAALASCLAGQGAVELVSEVTARQHGETAGPGRQTSWAQSHSGARHGQCFCAKQNLFKHQSWHRRRNGFVFSSHYGMRNTSLSCARLPGIRVSPCFPRIINWWDHPPPEMVGLPSANYIKAGRHAFWRVLWSNTRYWVFWWLWEVKESVSQLGV